MATETASRTAQIHELAQQLRVDSIRSTTQAGSGHPTSSMSAADLAAVLLAGHLRYDFKNPENPNNDHLILSKGHAAPLLYAVYKATGAITDDELLTLLARVDALEGQRAQLVERRLGQLAHQALQGEPVAGAPVRFDEVRQQDRLARAQRVRVHVHEAQQPAHDRSHAL